MNIQSINNNYNVSMYGAKPSGNGPKKFWNKIKQKALDALPNKTFKESEKNVSKWEKLNSQISEPAKNRAIMGGAAILTQPAIDYYNHRVDDETRTVSRNRTIAKIVAGTLVGIMVRGLVHKGVIKMTDINGITKQSKLLLPKDFIEKMKDNETLLKNYRSAISTCSAIGIMSLFTNILLDAPLTMYFTNKLNKFSKVSEPERKEAMRA